MATAEASHTAPGRNRPVGLLVLYCVGLGLILCSGQLRAEAQAPAMEPPAPVISIDAPAAADPEQLSRQVVENFHAELIDVMKRSDELAFAEREAMMARAVDEAFDMVLMAKASIGSAWKALDESERKEWVDLSQTYSASNYANNFVGWSGQTFETRGVEKAARGTVLVKTEFVQESGDNVLFDYRLRKVEKGWRVIDVQIDGKVSEITLRRANYRAVIERKGWPQLLAEVEKKVEQFRTE